MIRFRPAALFLLLAGCADGSTAPTGDLPVELEVLDAHQVEVGSPGDTPIVLVEARVRNPTTTAIVLRPDCGGLFGLERWSGSEWIRYQNDLVDCIPDPTETIAAGATVSATRTFGIELGQFRIVVEESPTVGQRARRSASFEVRN